MECVLGWDVSVVHWAGDPAGVPAVAAGAESAAETWCGDGVVARLVPGVVAQVLGGGRFERCAGCEGVAVARGWAHRGAWKDSLTDAGVAEVVGLLAAAGARAAVHEDEIPVGAEGFSVERHGRGGVWVVYLYPGYDPEETSTYAHAVLDGYEAALTGQGWSVLQRHHGGLQLTRTA